MATPQAGSTSQGTLARIAALAVAGKKKAEDEDEDKNKKKDAKADDKDGDGDDDSAKAGDDKDGDDEARASDDENCDDEDMKSKKSKKDAKAEDDDEKDDDEKDAKNKKAARAQERARIKAILTSQFAALSAAHYANALYIATETSMDSKSAIGMLRCMPVSEESPSARQQQQSARERMAQTPNPDVGADAGPGDDGKGPSLAQKIVAAGKKRRGEA